MSTVGQRRRLSNPDSRAQFLYEARGESAAALKSYLEGNGNSLTRQHNLALLTYLANNRKTTDQTYLSALKSLRSHTDNGGESCANRLPLHQLVLSYNLALHAFYTREFETAKSIIYPICECILNYEGGLEDMIYGDLKCKIAFLAVDCMLEIFDLESVGNVLNWIERYVTFRSGASTADENCNGDETISFQQESDMELKFRLHCYRARYLFMCAEDDRTSLELNLKKVRKELKNAMEIYNHNLSGKKINGESMEDGTASIQDSVSPSVDSGHGMANDHHRHRNIAFLSNGISNGSANDVVAPNQNEDSQVPFELRLSNAQNQHVLFLKARLEYLKGNCNKSMKLCSEAQNAMDKNSSDETTNILHAIYNNNMGLVYQSARQFHLALHYYALALSFIEIPENETDDTQVNGVTLHRDGTVQQISVEQLLYNTAICSQACGNYVGSCECMIRFIQLSKKCSKHPFPWLHLSESYIGK
jgi:tetratricopeptide (TPR) repeat protein